MVKKHIHIFAAFLVLVFLSMYLTMPLYVSLCITEIKQAQQNKLHDNRNVAASFIKIEISRSLYEKITGTGIKEFIYRKSMYDIKNTAAENGKYYVYTLADKQETALQKLNTRATNSTSGKNTKVYKKTFFSFISRAEEYTCFFINPFAKKVLNTNNVNIPQGIIFKIIKPPPDDEL